MRCCIEIQGISKNVTHLDLRIGIHQGEILLEGNDVIGDDVNIASRIESFSATGGIAISNKVNDAVIREKEFDTKYLGKPRLKGVEQKVEVYCITSHGLPETNVSKVNAKLEPIGFQWNLFSLTGAILTFIGIAFWINVSFLDIGTAKSADVPSVAILLMENLGNNEDEFWARNFTEDLILHIANSGLIRVSTIRQVQNLNKDISYQDVGKDLNVKHVLISSIQKIDEKFNLRCQLIEASTGVSSFGMKYQEKLTNAQNIVSSLGDKILNSLNVITNETIELEEPKYNADAYEFFLKGKFKLTNSKNEESIEIARGCFLKRLI